jgi:hypothetical protein
MAKEAKDMAEHLKGSKREAKDGEKRESGKESKMKLSEMRIKFGRHGGADVEHRHEDENGKPLPNKHHYPMQDMDDLQQHMEEHAAPEMEGPQGAGDGQGSGEMQGTGEDGGGGAPGPV